MKEKISFSNKIKRLFFAGYKNLYFLYKPINREFTLPSGDIKMAKGMRSKIKRRFRAIKRQSVFAPVEAARAQRLAAKQVQAAGLQQQTKSTLKEKEESQEQSPPQHTTENPTLGTKDITSGSLCYEILGLIDPDIIDSTNFEGLMSALYGVLGDGF